MDRESDNLPGNQHQSRIFSSGIVLSIAGFAVSVNALPPLATTLATRYAVSPGLFGIVFFFQYISFTLFSSAGGYLYGKEKGNPVNVLVVSLLLAGVIVGFIGKVPSFVLLVFFMVAIGGFGGIVESTGTMILSENRTDSRLRPVQANKINPSGRLVYVSQLFYCLGALFAPMIVGILLAGGVSISFIGLAVGLLTVGIALAVIATTRGKSVVHQSKVFLDDRAQGTFTNELQVNGPPLKIFIWFLTVMFLYVMLEASVSSWLPIYLETAFSLTPSRSAFHLTLFWTGLAGTRFLYIFIHSRTIRAQLAIQIAGIAISVSALLLTSESPALHSVLIFLLGLSCGPVWPMIINLYSRYFLKENYIMYLVSAGSAGALAGIFITSTLIGFIGIQLLMTIVFVYSLLIATGSVGLLKATRSSRITQ